MRSGNAPHVMAPSQHRDQPAPAGRMDQHRRRPTTSRPTPTRPNPTRHDLLRCEFAGTLALYSLPTA